nr:MAG TPA: hypothetical protein [Caudoviricetes sp.]
MAEAPVADKRKASVSGFSPLRLASLAECTAWPCPPASRS